MHRPRISKCRTARFPATLGKRGPKLTSEMLRAGRSPTAVSQLKAIAFLVSENLAPNRRLNALPLFAQLAAASCRAIAMSMVSGSLSTPSWRNIFTVWAAVYWL